MSEENQHTTIEETEYGYRTMIESKRGTGTRDQDKVRMEARTTDYPTSGLLDMLENDVETLMERRREHHPDEEGDE